VPLFAGETLQPQITRTYNVYVPDHPLAELAPTIIVFNGGGQSTQPIARNWGVGVASAPPASLVTDRYMLVFPESDPSLGDSWIHFHNSDPAFATYDLEFVDQLLTAIIDHPPYETGDAAVPSVGVDPDLVYTAGFSNGAGMVWQLMNSDAFSSFRGFAAVGKALDPEKALHYEQQLGTTADPAPAIYVQGTADRNFRPPATLEEVPLSTTHPANTVKQMLARNRIPAAPAVTTLVPGSTNATEVVIQLFEARRGGASFECVTVVGGGHNWPSPAEPGPQMASHFDATLEIVTFWQNHARLPAI